MGDDMDDGRVMGVTGGVIDWRCNRSANAVIGREGLLMECIGEVMIAERRCKIRNREVRQVD